MPCCAVVVVVVVWWVGGVAADGRPFKFKLFLERTKSIYYFKAGRRLACTTDPKKLRILEL